MLELAAGTGSGWVKWALGMNESEPTGLLKRVERFAAG